MKTKINLILGLIVLSTLVCGNLSAQTINNVPVSLGSATNSAPATNQDVLVVTFGQQ